jgi:hypothetical protein
MEAAALRERVGSVDRLQSEVASTKQARSSLDAERSALQADLAKARGRIAEVGRAPPPSTRPSALPSAPTASSTSTATPCSHCPSPRSHSSSPFLCAPLVSLIYLLPSPLTFPPPSLPSLPPPSPQVELEAAALRERVVEADRLQHELSATREKLRAVEQRSVLLEKERAGAASQLEMELAAARSKISAIEARRRRRTGDDASTVLSASSPRTTSTRLSPPTAGARGPTSASTVPRHRSAHRTTHRSSREPSPALASRDRYAHGTSEKRLGAKPRGTALRGNADAYDASYGSYYQ